MKNSDTAKRPVRVGLISLGCAKNLVDAEIMLGSLMKGGVEITNDAAQADCVVVNTCSFIDSAQEESVDTILESAAVREAGNRGQALVVSGCLPQRFRDQLPKLLPEVDVFMGIDQVTQVADLVRLALARRAEKLVHSPQSTVHSPQPTVGIQRLGAVGRRRSVQSSRFKVQGSKFASSAPSSILNPPSSPVVSVTPRPLYIPDYATPRFQLTPRHFAYLKIAEGCNHPCSFCIIPRMRGSHRSRQADDIVAEAKGLLANGVRELNLISQDSTYYG